MAGNVHNDICDFEIDLVNQPNRPLPSRQMGFIAAWFLTLNLTGMALVGALFSGELQFWLAFLMAFLLYFYNRFFKKWPFIGNLSVALLCGLAVVFPTLPFLNAPLAAAFIFAFSFTLTREMFKDLEDIKGDTQHGAKTLAILIPSPWNYRIPAAIWVVLTLLTALFGIFNIYSKTFLLMSSIFVVIPSVIGIWKFKNPNHDNWKKQQKLLKWIILGGMLSIVLDQIWPL